MGRSIYYRVEKKLVGKQRKRLAQHLAALYLSGRGNDARQHIAALIDNGALTEDEGRNILSDALLFATPRLRFRHWAPET